MGASTRSPGQGQEDGHLGAAPSARIRFGPAPHTSCQLCGSLSQCVPLCPVPARRVGITGAARGPSFFLSCASVTSEDTVLGPFSGREQGVARAADTYPCLSISKSISRAVCYSVLRALFSCSRPQALTRGLGHLIDGDGMKAYALPVRRKLRAWRRGKVPPHPKALRLPVHQSSQWAPRSHQIGTVILGTLLGFFGLWSQWESLL